MNLKLMTGGVVAALALLAASGPAQAQEISPTDRQDVICFALFAAILGNPEVELGAEERVGIASGVTYYLGRLHGRTPGFDWLAWLGAHEEEIYSQVLLDSEAQRCGAEITAVGEAMTAFGNS